MDDKAGLVLLEREHSNIGVVNPIFMRFKEQEVKLKAATAGNPFRDTSDMVLLPLHIDDNHWCGVVFDFRLESRFWIHCKRPSQSITMPVKRS
jgi:hypothetical protein